MQSLFPKSEPQLKRGSQKECQVCLKKFSITTRQHQCKRCLKAVCSDCGNYQREVYSSNFLMRSHRVCKRCKDGSEYICEYVKNNNLRFGEMSQVGQKWAKKMTKKSIEYGNNTSQHKLLTKEAFSQLWNSYSFQLRELVGVLTFQLNQETVYDVVYNVFTTVISATSGYTVTQIIYLIMFILCFCSTDRAALLVIYLLELKPNPTQMNNMTISYLKTMPFKNQYSKIEKYIAYRLERYMDSFMVNCITIEASISLINKTMDRKNVEELLMIFAAHIFANRQLLAKKIIQYQKPMIDYLMMRNCLLEDITANFKYIKAKNISLLTVDVRKSTPINLRQNQQQMNGLKRKQTLGNNLQDKYTFQDYLPNRQSLNFTKDASVKEVNAVVKSDYRESVENSFQDSRNFKKSPEGIQINIGNSFEYMQQSPPVNSISAVREENSPFRKAIIGQLSEEQLPQFFQMIEPIPIRKITIDGSDKKSFQACEKCQYYIEESEKLANKTKQKQLQWAKFKQELETIIEKDKAKLQQINEDNIEWQKKYSEVCHKYKQTDQNLSKTLKQLASTQQKRISLQKTIQQINRQKGSVNQQSQRYLTIIESQKRQLKETKQMFIETHKKLQTNNLKLKSSQSLIQQQADKQNKLKSIVDVQEGDIKSLKRKITLMQQSKEKQNQNIIQQLQQNLKKCETQLQNITNQNSKLRQSLESLKSQSKEKIEKYQLKIKALSQTNGELQTALKESMAQKGQQSNFFIKKTASQEKIIKDLNIQIKSYQVEIVQSKEKAALASKELTKSDETIQSLKKSGALLQEDNRLNDLKLQKYEQQLLHLNNKIEQLKGQQQQTLLLLKGKQQYIKQLQLQLSAQRIVSQKQVEYRSALNKQLKIKQDQINLLKLEIGKQSKTNENIMDKLSQISELMMLIESQKLQLAEQNFTLHEIIKKHHIKIQ